MSWIRIDRLTERSNTILEMRDLFDALIDRLESDPTWTLDTLRLELIKVYDEKLTRIDDELMDMDPEAFE